MVKTTSEERRDIDGAVGHRITMTSTNSAPHVFGVLVSHADGKMSLANRAYLEIAQEIETFFQDHRIAPGKRPRGAMRTRGLADMSRSDIMGRIAKLDGKRVGDMTSAAEKKHYAELDGLLDELKRRGDS